MHKSFKIMVNGSEGWGPMAGRYATQEEAEAFAGFVTALGTDPLEWRVEPSEDEVDSSFAPVPTTH